MFALFDLLGLSFVPRLRDAGDLRPHGLGESTGLPVDVVLRSRARPARDGVSERRTADGGRIGESGLRAILAGLGPRSAARTVRGLQDAVISASSEALRDDATMLVIAAND